nr:MAG: hypothetical protein EDM05_32135 [Leptolyngbya sp. IPPAS B-1204]
MLSKLPIKATLLTLTTATIFSGSALLTPKAAFAGVASIGQQLIDVAIAAGLMNRTPTHEPHIGTLRAGRSHVVNINLRSGVTYNLISVCDEYCTDVDIKLYDENSNLVDSDIRSNDIAIVSVTPRWSGEFYVKVDLVNCSANYCYYGVGVFGQ